uniref:ADP-ribosylarginine hydrolase n=1 Tax=Xiphophorus couchianus TaxID=32473 RepID=A0A3B5KP56_9TELE
RYVEAMKDMEGRKPGPSSILGTFYLKNDLKFAVWKDRCAAVMCSIRYPKPDQLLSLVAVAVETGRMTHPHPTGFLGAVASALFASYAVQRRPMTTWGLGLINEACPVARTIIQETIKSVFNFTFYLCERFIGRFLMSFTIRNLTERDEAYKSFSLSGWAGRSGHDAPMIALDALLGAGSDWEELMNRAAFHGGALWALQNMFIIYFFPQNYS